jgi:hypothetical protein
LNAELSWFGFVLACDADTRVLADYHLSCTLALIRRCTRIAIAASPDATGLTDENLVRDADLAALVTWLYELHLGADMKLFLTLPDLSLLGQRVLRTCPRVVELDALWFQYTQQKAALAGGTHDDENYSFAKGLISAWSSCCCSSLLRVGTKAYHESYWLAGM